ncbi:rhodanese-like domain-containing protein [Pseudodesulfovibrio nedwellii]|uniref:Rhodanese-like domain-containing protein n=1 Tax=Pseudodesulfovibrio nedwellii TaxID=2973072 RepID=A0ABM8AZG0_9BACT|nr:rhodanese-like domain-containing protein [Pseudodesulfovibrio nedwellii]BDQ36869.1 rhodanese-like domain-containing protein [Pseudodesulfovibrio nedwellii]
MKIKIIVPSVILIAAALLFYVNMNPPLPEGYVDFDAKAAQVQLVQSSDVLILDVRTFVEFRDGHINNAVNIDFYRNDFERKLKALDRNAQYFVYCRTGNRSLSTLKLMHRLGFTKVWHLNKGVVDWKESGLPLSK